MQNPGSLLSGREGQTQMKLLHNYIMNHVKTHSRMGCSEAVWRVGEAAFRLCGTLKGLTALPWGSSWRTCARREYNTFKHKTLVGTKALREENGPQGKVIMETETPLLCNVQYRECAAESRHRGRPGCSTLFVWGSSLP